MYVISESIFIHFIKFIVGGTDTKLGEFPWMALIGSKNSGGTLEWTCGGTLINKW